MRSILVLFLTAFSVALSLTGCSGVPFLGNEGGGASAGRCDPILFIREGVTTQTDVSARCGPPTIRERTDAGMNWIYDPDYGRSTGDVLAESCGEMSGVAYQLCVASMPAKLYMTVEFDRNGVVMDYTARKEARQPPPPANE